MKNLPFFTLWKNKAALEDGYVTRIEPGTGFPNTRRFERERGRIVRMKPQEKYNAEITFSVHVGKGKVAEILEEIEKIRDRTTPEVHKEPVRDFSLG